MKHPYFKKLTICNLYNKKKAIRNHLFKTIKSAILNSKITSKNDCGKVKRAVIIFKEKLKKEAL